MADARTAARALKQKLEALASAGVTHLGKPPAGVAPLAAPAAASPRPAASSAPAPGPSLGQSSTSPSSAPPARPASPAVAPSPAPLASKPVTPVAKPAAKPAAAAPSTALGAAPGSLLAPGSSILSLPDLPDEQRLAQLNIIRTEVQGCTRCKELSSLRTQTVFGVGTVRPRLVFCGEAPGADEDKQGEPFVGMAGQLLTKIIEACTLKRQDVYILNVLKCRPPGNRVPNPDEVEHCRGYLERQLQILRPEYLCALGATAAKTLLNTTVSIGKLRGKFHDYHGIPVLCTYHPSYLLRNPSAKKDVWEDMQVLMGKMGIELPKK